jgi:transcriptional regulator with XRE-family HTH domain
VTLPQLNRTRFAQFIKRGLDNARARGLTDPQIAKAAGIPASTFHRWQNGQQIPRLVKLEMFCRGLGLNLDEALATLRTDIRQTTAPDPPMDPDVLKLLRKLADPDVSATTKTHIRATLRYLADLPEPNQTPRRRRRAS